MRITIVRKCLTAAILVAMATAFAGCGATHSAGESESDAEAVSYETEAAAEAATEMASMSETESTGITIPYELDGGRLVVNSVFTSDIMNPDAENADGTNIVAIELQNNSETTLVAGDVTVTLDDGTEVPFHVSYLPAGENVWTFASDNTMAASPVAKDITATTEYAATSVMMEDTFEVSVTDSEITLTNISGADQYNITVYCHCKLDNTNFGGITYTYPVDALSTGESVTIDAEDCLLGEAEVAAIVAD